MRFSFLVILLCVMLACSTKKEKEATGDSLALTYTVERAPEWTEFFHRTSGWFGGDGIFAIPYSGIEAPQATGDSVLFLFSDTMVGQINDGKLVPGYHMVNNSVAVLKGKEPEDTRAHFMVATDKEDKPVSLFIPNTPNANPGEYYWLGDGFVNHALDSNLYVFAYRIMNTGTNDLFPFKEVGNNVLVIPHHSAFPFTDHRQLDVPFFTAEEEGYSSVGAGVLVNTEAAGAVTADGYIYIYGVRGPRKELITARVDAPAFENFDAWRFWDGHTWTDVPGKAAAIADSVSNELSMTPLADGRYALIYQYSGIFPTIYMQVGDTPVGPFGERRKLWDTTTDIHAPELDLFTYNAKAHPAISKPGELLVSYNVNSFKFFDVIERMPDLYRPRFIRIIFE